MQTNKSDGLMALETNFKESYNCDDYTKHFDGTEYNYDIEFMLKHSPNGLDRQAYNASRIAHENRRWGLKRGIPTVCQEWLDNNFK